MFDSSIKNLEKLISYSSLRQKVINNNITNVTTIDYKRKEVKFKDIYDGNLSAQIKTTNEKHLPLNDNSLNTNSDFLIVDDNNTEMSSGFNNVNIDQEMSDLAENSITFKFAAKKLSDYFKGLQSIIKGGGRV